MPLDLDPVAIMEKALEVAASRLESQPEIAEMLLRQALKVDPEDPKALSLLGLTLYRRGKSNESVEYFKQSLVVKADDPDTLNNLALAYASLEEYEKSAECLQQALAIKPIRPTQFLFLNNLALQHRQMGQFDLALGYFKQALALEPHSPMIWCNLGGLYADIKNWEYAEFSYAKAIECDPEAAAPHVFISYIYGYRRDWEKAFTEYEHRFDHFDQLKHYRNVYDPDKKWTGEPLSGKTIILYGEQGWGDQIQYIRYAADLDARVIVHCAKPLEKLFARLPWVDQAFSDDITSLEPDKVPAHDCHCSLISLPYLLGDFNPKGCAYIKPSSVLRIDTVEEYRDQLRVGIAWAGSPLHPNDQCRSIPLREFETLQIDGVRLFSLQVGGSKRYYTELHKTIDFAEGGERVRMVDLTPLLTDYEQTAAVISGLDLIISADTSVVHLAGAMGIPCWVLLPYNSDWRWGDDGERTVWYDSLRLFRQGNPKDWSSVMQSVKGELQRVSQDLLQDKRSELQEAQAAGCQQGSLSQKLPGSLP